MNCCALVCAAALQYSLKLARLHRRRIVVLSLLVTLVFLGGGFARSSGSICPPSALRRLRSSSCRYCWWGCCPVCLWDCNHELSYWCVSCSSSAALDSVAGRCEPSPTLRSPPGLYSFSSNGAHRVSRHGSSLELQ
ncbi:hypothetical protein FB45DRAFT_933421 [Roridomyces roridus]|uniref:Uncharacterized protein n=1 Tax=Roridomyces roridus TaxID=1738132 RepID=A0AAD7BCS4_9AGAR|nr:hypothetical protein FB45DRAFT_933421 [Roridomyces roridus]